MTKISPLAIIHPKAIIEDDVKIHPYAIIEENVKIGRGSEVFPFAKILAYTEIGANNKIYQGCLLGTLPLDLKFRNERSFLLIGANNIIREYTTISRATGKDQKTEIGDHNFIMAYCHIAHNVKIGHNNIITNHSQIAGHCEIFDWVNIGGNVGLHQFVRVGSYAFVGAFSYLKKDLLPFMIGEGNPFRVRGVNTIGLLRLNFSQEKVSLLRKVYRVLYHSNLNLSQALEYIQNNFERSEEVETILHFIANSRRGIELRS